MRTANIVSLLLALLSPLTSATFSLNVSGPDWAYGAADLAPTTSLGCQTAYSASIDCDATLLGLVASMRPAFDPDSSDLDKTCTTTCSDSLAAYMKGVEGACSAPGDKAQESPGGSDENDFILDPVQIVGQIFQYTWAQSCSKATNGTYCYLGNMAYAETGIPCADKCAMQFYTNAHNMPAAGYEFNYYWLVSISDWWADEFVSGWQAVQQCDGGGNGTSSSSSDSSQESGTVTVDLQTSSALSTVLQSGPWITSTGTVAALASSALVTSAGSSSVLNSATSAAKPTASSNSGPISASGKVSGVVTCLLWFGGWIALM